MHNLECKERVNQSVLYFLQVHPPVEMVDKNRSLAYWIKDPAEEHTYVQEYMWHSELKLIAHRVRAVSLWATGEGGKWAWSLMPALFLFTT